MGAAGVVSAVEFRGGRLATLSLSGCTGRGRPGRPPATVCNMCGQQHLVVDIHGVSFLHKYTRGMSVGN
jgi:hypothetical protein